MTSSCFYKPVGPRRGPLQASMGFHGLGKQCFAWKWHFSDHMALGPPKGAVARFLSLGEASFAWETDFLGWVGWLAGHLLEIVHEFPDGPIYAGKTSILDSKPRFSLEIL